MENKCTIAIKGAQGCDIKLKTQCSVRLLFSIFDQQVCLSLKQNKLKKTKPLARRNFSGPPQLEQRCRNCLQNTRSNDTFCKCESSESYLHIANCTVSSFGKNKNSNPSKILFLGFQSGFILLCSSWSHPDPRVGPTHLCSQLLARGSFPRAMESKPEVKIL